MLYIHTLKHLTPKSADLESVYLVREIKNRTGYPLSPGKVNEHFSSFFLSDTDQESIAQALSLVEPTRELVNRLKEEKDSLHEAVNLHRTAQILDEMALPLSNNLQFAQEINNWQNNFASEATLILNKLPELRSPEEKNTYNQQLNNLFQTILRNKEFSFNAEDVVNEAQLNHIQGLYESLDKGFLFHVTIEEEIKKQNFETIRERIAPERLAEAEFIKKNTALIKKGVERAYQMNMRMVNWSVLLYSYVKWLIGGV